MSTSLLRMPAVSARVGLRKTAIYDRIKRNQFPTPIALGNRNRAWSSDDIDLWIAQQIAASRTPGKAPE